MTSYLSNFEFKDLTILFWYLLRSIKAFIDIMFESFNDTKIGHFFKLTERGTNLVSEFRGATATFLSMAYILAVNPRILSDSGGPCDPVDYPDGGIFSPGYEACMEDVKKQFITATALVSIFGE